MSINAQKANIGFHLVGNHIEAEKLANGKTMFSLEVAFDAAEGSRKLLVVARTEEMAFRYLAAMARELEEKKNAGQDQHAEMMEALQNEGLRFYHKDHEGNGMTLYIATPNPSGYTYGNSPYYRMSSNFDWDEKTKQLIDQYAKTHHLIWGEHDDEFVKVKVEIMSEDQNDDDSHVEMEAENSIAHRSRSKSL
jgi:hypothetical protein